MGNLREMLMASTADLRPFGPFLGDWPFSKSGHQIKDRLKSWRSIDIAFEGVIVEELTAPQEVTVDLAQLGHPRALHHDPGLSAVLLCPATAVSLVQVGFLNDWPSRYGPLVRLRRRA